MGEGEDAEEVEIVRDRQRERDQRGERDRHAASPGGGAGGPPRSGSAGWWRASRRAAPGRASARSSPRAAAPRRWRPPRSGSRRAARPARRRTRSPARAPRCRCRRGRCGRRPRAWPSARRPRPPGSSTVGRRWSRAPRWAAAPTRISPASPEASRDRNDGAMPQAKMKSSQRGAVPRSIEAGDRAGPSTDEPDQGDEQQHDDADHGQPQHAADPVRRQPADVRHRHEQQAPPRSALRQTPSSSSLQKTVRYSEMTTAPIAITIR